MTCVEACPQLCGSTAQNCYIKVLVLLSHSLYLLPLNDCGERIRHPVRIARDRCPNPGATWPHLGDLASADSGVGNREATRVPGYERSKFGDEVEGWLVMDDV